MMVEFIKKPIRKAISNVLHQIEVAFKRLKVSKASLEKKTVVPTEELKIAGMPEGRKVHVGVDTVSGELVAFISLEPSAYANMKRPS